MTPRPSLWERARRGWLLLEPELELDEVLDLEYPQHLVKRCPELAARKEILRAALETEIDVDDEFARQVVGDDGGLPGTWMIDREAFRTWRAQCPPELLYGLSHFKKWLGDPPATPPPPGKREIVKAGEDWRHKNPGQSRAKLKAALVAQFRVDVLNAWIDEIMKNTPDVPRHKGGKSDPP